MGIKDGHAVIQDEIPIMRAMYLGLYDYVYPLDTDLYDNRMEHRLEHTPDANAFRYACCNLYELEKSEQEIADQDHIYVWMDEWQFDD